MEVGEVRTLVIVAEITGTGNISNKANVTGNEHDSNLTNNNDSTTEEIPPAVDIVIDKEIRFAGNYSDEIIYVITVTNRGPDNATGVIVQDKLPDSLIFVSGDNYDPETGIWNVGDLASGEFETLVILAIINGTGNITNNVNVTSNEFDYNKTNNYDNVTVEIPKEVDLIVNKTVNDDSPFTGDEIIFEITITNNGVDNATNVYLEEILPDGLIYLNSETSKGSFNPSTGIWNVGNLAIGEIVTLNISVLVNKTGNLTNIVSVNSTEHDLNYTNNNDSVIVNVIPVADLAVDKEVNLDVVYVGDRVIFTITITNYGPDTAENVQALDKLPDGLRFLSSSATKGSYNSLTGIWDVGSLASGESVTLTIVTIAENEGIIVNNVSVNSSSLDFNMENNKDNSTVMVNLNIVPPSGENDKENLSNLASSGISMEKTGNPLVLALILIICLLGFGVKFRR